MFIEQKIKDKLIERANDLAQERYRLHFRDLIEPHKTIIYQLAIKDVYNEINQRQ